MRIKKINLTKFTLQVFEHVSATEKCITIPTIFTLIRIVLVPLVVGTMIANWWGYAFLLFTFASITDLIDGLLARLLNKRTLLGAFLDPIADKLLLVSCFFTLAFIHNSLFLMPQWFVLSIVIKELIQVVGAFLIYYHCGYLNVQPTILGKTTTFIQMIFITWLLASSFFCWMPIETYYIMLSIMAFFVGLSFVQYAWIGLRMLKNRK